MENNNTQQNDTTIDSDILFEQATYNMLISTYRRTIVTMDDKHFNSRVKKVYKEWYNRDLEHNSERVHSMFVTTPIGNGGTATLKLAAKTVAAALNLNYLENPSDDNEIFSTARREKIRENFLFLDKELFSPNEEKIKKVEVTLTDGSIANHLQGIPLKKWKLLEQVGGGYLLLNANTPPDIDPKTAVDPKDTFEQLSKTAQSIQKNEFNGLDVSNVGVGYISHTSLTGDISGLQKISHKATYFSNVCHDSSINEWLKTDPFKGKENLLAPFEPSSPEQRESIRKAMVTATKDAITKAENDRSSAIQSLRTTYGNNGNDDENKAKLK